MQNTSTSKQLTTAQRDDRYMKAGKAMLEALQLEMRRDSTVFLFGEDIQWGGKLVTRRLFEEFGPKRLLNAPIAENAIVSAGLGAALAGMRPVCEIMNGDFILLAADALFNQAAKYRYLSGGKFKVPLTLRIAGTGPGRGDNAHHSQCLESLAMHFPGLKVVFPSNPADAKGLLQSAIRDDNPVVYYEHRFLYGMQGYVPEGDHLVPIGKASVVREGRDVTVVSYAYGLLKAQKAAVQLAEKGIDVELIDLRTLLPLDKDTMLASIEKTGRLVVVGEDTKTMGAGAELAAIAAEEGFQYLKAPVRRVAILDTCIPGVQQTEAVVVPSVDDIVAAVSGLCNR